METGFTGGANLADRYQPDPTLWALEDAAIRLRGVGEVAHASSSFQMCTRMTGTFLSAIPERRRRPRESLIEGGFVIPFNDNPMDEEVAENLYIDMISRADRYVWVMTPYLILDGELEAAREFAADRGVDVHLPIAFR